MNLFRLIIQSSDLSQLPFITAVYSLRLTQLGRRPMSYDPSFLIQGESMEIVVIWFSIGACSRRPAIKSNLDVVGRFVRHEGTSRVAVDDLGRGRANLVPNAPSSASTLAQVTFLYASLLELKN